MITCTNDEKHGALKFVETNGELQRFECETCGLIIDVSVKLVQQGRKGVVKPDQQPTIVSELFDLFDGKIDWDYQCPPERRGAEIAMLHLLGLSWKAANLASLHHAPFRENLEKLVNELSAVKTPEDLKKIEDRMLLEMEEDG